MLTNQIVLLIFFFQLFNQSFLRLAFIELSFIFLITLLKALKKRHNNDIQIEQDKQTRKKKQEEQLCRYKCCCYASWCKINTGQGGKWNQNQNGEKHLQQGLAGKIKGQTS